MHYLTLEVQLLTRDADVIGIRWMNMSVVGEQMNVSTVCAYTQQRLALLHTCRLRFNNSAAPVCFSFDVTTAETIRNSAA